MLPKRVRLKEMKLSTLLPEQAYRLEIEGLR